MVDFVVDVHGFWGIVALRVKLSLRVDKSFEHVAECGNIVSEVGVLAVFHSCSALLN